MSITKGLRTWKRTNTDRSLPVNERILETTRMGPISRMIAEADFVTIPRAVEGSAGYDEDYAARAAQTLAQRLGFEGGIRLSQSGRSFVFERQAAPTGVSCELGIEVPAGLSIVPENGVLAA